MPLAQEIHGLSRATTLVPVARIGVPLLLKTILPRPAVAMGAPTGRIFFSIAMREAGSNEGSPFRYCLVVIHLRSRPELCISGIKQFL
jgi:hypothetical protein